MNFLLKKKKGGERNGTTYKKIITHVSAVKLCDQSPHQTMQMYWLNTKFAGQAF